MLISLLRIVTVSGLYYFQASCICLTLRDRQNLRFNTPLVVYASWNSYSICAIYNNIHFVPNCTCVAPVLDIRLKPGEIPITDTLLCESHEAFATLQEKRMLARVLVSPSIKRHSTTDRSFCNITIERSLNEKQIDETINLLGFGSECIWKQNGNMI